MSSSTTSKSSPSTYYIDKEEMVKEVIKSRETGVMTDRLARMILLLAEKISYRHCFIGYSYREDMVADAVLNLVCGGALKFDPSKSQNPFGYYTIAIHRSFIHFLHVEKKHRYIRDKLLIELGENPSFGFLEDHKDHADPELAKGMQDLRDDIERARKDPTPAPGEKRAAKNAKKDADIIEADVDSELENLEELIEAGSADDESFSEFVDESYIEAQQDKKDKRRSRTAKSKQLQDVVDSEIDRDLLVYQ